MGLEDFGKEIAREAHLIWDGIFVYAASLAVIAGGVWKAVSWQYSSRLDRLRQDVESERAEVARLRSQLSEPKPEKLAVAARPEAVTKHHEQQQVIAALQRAKDAARLGVSHVTDREAERVMPRMKAALLSANKQFGIPLIASAEDGPGPIIQLEARRRLLEKILPFLIEGHFEEAKIEAKDFISSLRWDTEA